MFVDPFTTHAVQLVDALTDAYPQSPIVGGLASGANQPGENRLFLEARFTRMGSGGRPDRAKSRCARSSSQGCRPIGQPLVATRGEECGLRLGGAIPMKILQEMLPQLPAKDRQLARSGLLFLGPVINEYQGESHGRGDFLIRNLIESDRLSRARWRWPI